MGASLSCNYRSCKLSSFRSDHETENEDADADNVMIPSTRRLSKRSGSHTSPRSSETNLTTTCAPSSDVISDKERSEIQQQSQPKVQFKASDKPGPLRLKAPKFIRPEPDMNSQTAKGVGRTSETLSDQSDQSPKRQCRGFDTPGVVQSSSNQSYPSFVQGHLASDVRAEVANAARQNLTALSTSLAPSSPFTGIPKMGIDAKKQSETTLWISVPSSTDAVPLELRSCMTMAALFDSVFRVCGLTEQEQQERVLGLRTSLVWMGITGVKKNVMLKREFEDCFETFLELIDRSPFWEEDGCCFVGIEPVMVEGTST